MNKVTRKIKSALFKRYKLHDRIWNETTTSFSFYHNCGCHRGISIEETFKLMDEFPGLLIEAQNGEASTVYTRDMA